MAEPEQPGPLLSGHSRPSRLLCALPSSVVVFDGRRLWHWADPFSSPAETAPRWTVLPRSADDPIVALTAGRRPATASVPVERAELLVAVSASGRWEAWRHEPGEPTPRWARYPVPPPPSAVRAVAAWFGTGGGPEVVLATTDGELVHQDLAGTQPSWSAIGRAPQTVAVDVLVRSNGDVELYALSQDGEVTRRTRPAGSVRWEGVEVVASWTEPVVAFTTWTFGDATEDQAALLDHGVVRQHWRRSGTSSWSEWWDAPRAAGPGEPAGLAALTCADEQLLVLLTDRDTVSVRRWVVGGGWRAWEPPVVVAHQPTTEPLASAPSPEAAVDPDTTTTLIPDPPTVPRTETPHPQSVRAESATVLFTGRALLPLEPADPREIGAFKLQKRVPGGQSGTDKYIARNGRGYCFLKVVRPDATRSEVAAFVRETEVARRVVERLRLTTYVDHREAGPDGPAYLALSYVPGQHLGDRIGRRPLTGAALVGMASSLLEALDELADCQLIHVDLKPANIILRDGDHPMIVDFGSAVLDHVRHLPEVFATPGYAAPELGAGTVGPGTDLYAWGAVVVAAATGEPPAADPGTRAAQLDRLPDKLRALVVDALSEEPADRPALADARRRLATATGPLDELINVRLAVDDDARRILPAGVRGTPRRLVQRAADLSPWRYRGAVGVAALAGIVLGLAVGTFLITFLRGA